MSQVQNLLTLELYRRLDEEIRRRPRGTIREIDRAVGRCVGWWQSRAETGDITVGQLLKILNHLGLDPVKFLRRGLGREDELELDRPQGEVPALVARAMSRFENGEEGRGVGARWIETLDELRYEDPEKAIKSAYLHVDDVELELLPKFLGVVGSALRLTLRLNEAEHVIHAGIRISTEEQRSLGDLLQRLSYIVADRGDHHKALDLAVRAGLLFLRMGERHLMGKAFVDQGVWLRYLGKYKEAIETLEFALELLPAGPSRNRFAVHQASGLAYLNLGKPEDALGSLEKAEKALPSGNQWDSSKLTWLRAKIYSDLDDLDQASVLFEELVDRYRELHFGEAAIASCELVRIQLRQGRTERAYATAISMRALVEPLRGNKVISAAIAGLLRSGQDGLTLTLIKQVMSQIESERQKTQTWQSLMVRPSMA